MPWASDLYTIAAGDPAVDTQPTSTKALVGAASHQVSGRAVSHPIANRLDDVVSETELPRRDVLRVAGHAEAA